MGQAVRHLERALAIKEREFGRDHVFVACALETLGCAPFIVRILIPLVHSKSFLAPAHAFERELRKDQECLAFSPASLCVTF